MLLEDYILCCNIMPYSRAKWLDSEYKEIGFVYDLNTRRIEIPIYHCHKIHENPKITPMLILNHPRVYNRNMNCVLQGQVGLSLVSVSLTSCSCSLGYES